MRYDNELAALRRGRILLGFQFHASPVLGLIGATRAHGDVK